MSDLKDILTCDLCDELAKRQGVQEIVGEPYQSLKIELSKKALQLDVNEGPFRVFVVYD